MRLGVSTRIHTVRMQPQVSLCSFLSQAERYRSPLRYCVHGQNATSRRFGALVRSGQMPLAGDEINHGSFRRLCRPMPVYLLIFINLFPSAKGSGGNGAGDRLIKQDHARVLVGVQPAFRPVSSPMRLVRRVGLRPTLHRAGHRPALPKNETTSRETALGSPAPERGHRERRGANSDGKRSGRTFRVRPLNHEGCSMSSRRPNFFSR
jgi:hypothetical protein